VDRDRGDEHQRSPVVDLPDEQAAAHLERQVQRRRERLGHLYPAQRAVYALVSDIHHRGVKVQRQVGARQQQHHEAVEGNLPEHERPVVREHLVDLPSQPGREVEPFIQLVGGLGHLCGQAR
jgi:hypothetical protein